MAAEKSPSLYVHVPFCRQKCPYCAFYSVPLAGQGSSDYVRAASAQIASYDHLGPFATGYLGGGSPAVLPRQQLLVLIGRIAEHLPAVAEFTLEINPDQASPTLLTELRKAGVNRLSIGGQSFNSRQLRFLGRTYRPKDITAACENARRAGFDNISIDLIYAIPGMTLQSWQATLEKAISLNPEHISTYSLSYEPATPMHHLLETGQIRATDEEIDRRMYEIAIDTLQKAHLEQYELSNFARPGRSCRHNMAYWLNEPYIGIGPAAHSSHNRRRWSNPADIDSYLADLGAKTDFCQINDVEFACETAVLNLRLTDGIDIERFRAQTGQDPLQLFAQPIEKHRRLGLIDVHNGKIALTRPAMPIADTVLCDFSSL